MNEILMDRPSQIVYISHEHVTDPAEDDAERKDWRDRSNKRQSDMDISQLRLMHRRQVAMYRREQVAIQALITIDPRGRGLLTDLQIQKLRDGLKLLTDDKLRARLVEIDVALMRLTRGSLDAAKTHEQLVGNLDDEQLTATMRRELMACAHSWSEEEWQVVEEIRAARVQRGAKAAYIATRAGMGRLAREARDGDR